jgi:tetrapyrrole methylase family protein / MazG family protein
MNSFKKLVQVMSRLRSAKGCPWDREQTHQSLLKYLYEESNELKQSIRKKDFENMEEELGDVLLQVLFHSQLAKEAGHFTIEDVVRTLTRKLTLRHPHVFGYKAEHRKLLKGKPLKSSADIVLSWDLLKKVSGKKRR